MEQQREKDPHFIESNKALLDENQRLKQMLEQSELRFDLLSKATNDAVWEWNLVTNQIWWNDGFKTLFGYKAENLGSDIDSWYGRIHPEDQHRVVKGIQHVIDQGGMQWSDLYRFRKADGSYLVVLDRGYALHDLQGKPYRLLGSMQDITQRKRSEQALLESRQRFQTLAETIPQLLWTSTPTGYVNYFNQQWYEYTGLTFENSKGEGWTSVFHPDELPSLQTKWQQALLTAQPFQNEARIRGVDHIYRWFLIRALPLNDPHGNIKQWIGTNTNIEEQKLFSGQLEALSEKLAIANDELKASNQDLAKVNERLSQTNEELDQYVYKVSHDIRSPVASIMGLLVLLKQEPISEQVQQYLDLMENRINRLDDFIKSVLSHSRSLNTQVAIVPINFEHIIDQCMDELQYYPDRDNVRIVKQLPQNGTFYGDELRLAIVFKNLISNAIKYRRQDVESFLTIQVTLSENQAKLVLKDNGQGIATAYQEKVFAMFFRATQQADGSGLGLYIVKQAVERMSGEIFLQSEPGKGTTFTVVIPDLMHAHK